MAGEGCLGAGCCTLSQGEDPSAGRAGCTLCCSEGKGATVETPGVPGSGPQRSSHAWRARSFAHRGRPAQAGLRVLPRDPKLASVISPRAPVASIPCQYCLCPFLLAVRSGRGGGYDRTLFHQIFNCFGFFLFDFSYPLPWLAPAGGSSGGPVPGHKAFLVSWEPRRTLHEYVKG